MAVLAVNADEMISILNLLLELPHRLWFSSLLRELRNRGIRRDFNFNYKDDVLMLCIGRTVGSINTLTKVVTLY